MVDNRQEILKKHLDKVDPNTDGTQAIYNAMLEFAGVMSMGFLKWHRENYYTFKASTPIKDLFENYLRKGLIK